MEGKQLWYKSASILDENYHSLSIIPRVIDTATIVAQQSMRQYFDLSSEHYIIDPMVIGLWRPIHVLFIQVHSRGV